MSSSKFQIFEDSPGRVFKTVSNIEVKIENNELVVIHFQSEGKENEIATTPRRKPAEFYNATMSPEIIDCEKCLLHLPECRVNLHNSIDLEKLSNCSKCPKSVDFVKKKKYAISLSPYLSKIQDTPKREIRTKNLCPKYQKFQEQNDNVENCKIPNGTIKNFICKICFKKFNYCKILMQHVKIYHSKSLYLYCKECGKSYRYEKFLKKHQKIHKQERQFICTECGKGFKSESILNQHQIVHTNIRPYICKTCKKAFKTEAVLIQHLRLHNNDKPYVCDICGLSYPQLNNLQYHRSLKH